MFKCSCVGLTFNANGAFVGTLTKTVDPPPSADGEIDDRSLTHSTFFADPLLPFGKPGYIEEKWSGTNQMGDNGTKISRIIAAFAHHSVVDSNKTCVLVDLQGLLSPDGSITLIDPQAHTCVIFTFVIGIVADMSSGHGLGVLVTLTVD